MAKCLMDQRRVVKLIDELTSIESDLGGVALIKIIRGHHWLTLVAECTDSSVVLISDADETLTSFTVAEPEISVVMDSLAAADRKEHED